MSKSKLSPLLVMLFGVSVLLIPLSVSAEIYKWTDENGKVHYSDKPIDDKSEKISIKLPPAASTPTQTSVDRKTKTDNFLRARQEERAEIDEKIAEKKKLKKQRKKKCKAAKKENENLIRARAIYYEGEGGAREYIGDEERARVLAEAKAEIKKWCK